MPIETHPVDIWMAHLDSPRPIRIVEAEAARAARLVNETDRVRWARSRSALREIVASYLDSNPLDVEFRYGEHGKPYVDNARGVRFNLSHSGEWAIVAVAIEVDVGVDVERIREKVNIAALLRRIGEADLPEERSSLFQRWARREASTKAVGAPLLRTVHEAIRVCDLKAPEGYVAAVAMPGFHPEPVYCGMR